VTRRGGKNEKESGGSKRGKQPKTQEFERSEDKLYQAVLNWPPVDLLGLNGGMRKRRRRREGRRSAAAVLDLCFIQS